MSPNNSSRKFFDVAQPGQTTPSATSRPVVTGNKSTTQDPFLHEAIKPPLNIPPAATQPAPEPPKDLDPTALLIQASEFVPPKASRSSGRHMVVVAMALFLVLVCAVSFWLVATM